MPVILDDDEISLAGSQSNANKFVPKYAPKEWNKLLTGTNGAVGILGTGWCPYGTFMQKNTKNYVKYYMGGAPARHEVNGGNTIDTISVYPVYEEISRTNSIKLMPKLLHTVDISLDGTTPLDAIILPTSVQIRKSQTSGGVQTQTVVQISYALFVFKTFDPTVKTYNLVETTAALNHATENTCLSIENDFYEICNNIITNVADYDADKFIAYSNSYSVYEGVSYAIENYYDNIMPIIENAPSDAAERIISIMENYKFDISNYEAITKLPNYNKNWSKRNMNLRLLNILAYSKNNINNFNSPIGNIKVNVSAPYSKMQIAAIQSPNSLTLVQSGAGTGKSSVILGRMMYMNKTGIPNEDILMLSFTNTAADNIKLKNPYVKSQTIASMINEIYNNNYDHMLSSFYVFKNSVSIYFPNDDFAYEFVDALGKAEDGCQTAFTSLWNMVEDNYDDIINILNVTNQTTLTLQSLICAVNMPNMKIPSSIACKHVLIDEVQDNSMFEFIYLLQFINHTNCSLFMVGDCAQTLYEFRLANPKALNILESSGIFTTYKLDINYRSNQYILDYANVMLSDIAANKYAQIQLQSNQMVSKTEQGFSDTVKVNFVHVKTLKDFDNNIAVYLARNADFIQDSIKNGKQIAFLCRSRANARKMIDFLEHNYPNCITKDIMPTVYRENTFFSKYIVAKWDTVKYMPNQTLTKYITQDMFNFYSTHKGIASLQKQLGEFNMQHMQIINNLCYSVSIGAMKEEDMLDKVKTMYLEFEIQQNALKSRLISARNTQKKSEDLSQANFVVSTIHSVKGLEFDNVVLLFKDEFRMSEEDKRMYYVGLTRAKEKELVIAYSTSPASLAVTNYDNLMTILKGDDEDSNAAE